MPDNTSTPAERPRRHLREDEQLGLAQFARLEISLDELRARLREVMDFEVLPYERRLFPYFDRPEPGIQIEKWHIENALQKRREGEVTKKELADWASMLLMNDAYVWPEDGAEWITDRLNRIAIPQIFPEDEYPS